MILKRSAIAAIVVVICSVVPVVAQPEEPDYLRDRGTGIPVSMFGTYINKGELLVYPFYEYYHDNNYEYEAAEFGYGSTDELRGQYEAHEFLLFIGYGISDRLALELEAGVITAELEKSPGDLSPLPAEFSESGISDVEGQLRWRWVAESQQRPEIFSYFETVFPTGEKNSLIGTSDWEFKLGSGLVKGFSFGTMTVRLAAEYSAEEDKFESGEYAVEYLRKLSNTFKIFVGAEGSEDEIELITDLQIRLRPNITMKINNAFGVTSKATDYAPEFGVLFSF